MRPSETSLLIGRRAFLGSGAAWACGHGVASAQGPVRPGVGVIDVHAHFLPPVYRQALADAGLSRLDGGMPIPAWTPQAAIEVMDRYGIAKSVLSVSSPGLNFVPAQAEARLARQINEAAAQFRADSGGRFGAFATLPASDPAQCLAEMEHALGVLELDGVVLESNHRGRYPGHPDFEPMLAALNARKAVVFIHPTSPACLACVGLGRPGPLIEFPFDTTRAAVDLIYSGALKRHPDIRFILAHAGGTLPFLTERVAGFSSLGLGTTGVIGPDDVRDAVLRFYYDTALSSGPTAMQALLSVAPPSQIMFGSDWPFSPERSIGGALQALASAAGPAEPHLGAILRDNAIRLLAG